MNKNLLILAAIIILAVGGIYYFQSVKPKKLNTVQNNQATAQVSASQNQIMVGVDAKKWQFTPNIINVKRGQRVKIIINNIDAKHGINLPDFGVNGNDSIEFIADKTGTFPFLCNNFCGSGHTSMLGKIIVTD